MRKKISALIVSLMLITSIGITSASALHIKSEIVVNPSSVASSSISSENGNETESTNSKSNARNGSDSQLFFALIAVVLIAGVSIGFIKSRIKSKRKESLITQNKLERIPKDYTKEINEEIIKRNPKFNTENFVEWSKKVFTNVLYAWSEGNLSKVRYLERDILYTNQEKKLQEYKNKGQINIAKDINIDQAYLHRYVRDDNDEYITVFIAVRMKYYVVDAKSNEIVMGKDDKDCYLKYLLTFGRHKNFKLSDIKKESIPNVCPNCGSNKITPLGKCNGCGKLLVNPTNNKWLLTNFDPIKPDTKIYNDDYIIVKETKKSAKNKNKTGITEKLSSNKENNSKGKEEITSSKQ